MREGMDKNAAASGRRRAVVDMGRRSAPGALRRRARAGAWRVVVIFSRGRGDSGEALAGEKCNGGAMPSPSSCQSLSSHAGRRCSPA